MTLWPEIEKVFGHGYEVKSKMNSLPVHHLLTLFGKSISLAVSSSKKFAATACKATTAEHAVVRVYDTATWQPVGHPLAGHSLTVTRISFSPNDQFVLSVSRDRSWRLYDNQASNGKSETSPRIFSQSGVGFVSIAADKSHGRIIWDCDWAPDSTMFATASRDKTVRHRLTTRPDARIFI